MLKKIFACLALSLASLGSFATSSEFVEECEKNLEPARVLLSVAQALPAVEIKSTTLREATYAVHKTTDMRRQVTLGYTLAQPNMSYRYEALTLQSPEADGMCARLVAHLDMGYSAMEVFIAQELSPNSCAFNTILEHELEHVRIYEQFLLTLSDRMNRAFEERAPLPVVYGQSNEDLSEKLRAQLLQTVVPVAVGVMREVYVAQHAFDSPEETAMLYSSCNGEVRSIVNRQLLLARR